MPGVDLLFFEEGQAVYGIDSFDGTKFVSEIRAFSPETGESESLWSGEMGSRGISAYREFYPMEVYHGKWLIEETSEEGENGSVSIIPRMDKGVDCPRKTRVPRKAPNRHRGRMGQ